jgi:hypothetical protein
MREFTKITECGSVVGSCGGFRSGKRPKVNLSFPHCDLCAPFLSCCIYALESAFVITLLGTIRKILRNGRWTKVVAAIVECISVSMIGVLPICASNYRMKVNESWFSRCAATNGIIAAPYRRPKSAPIPSHQPCILTRVNERVLAFCQWNYLVRWIERLNNRIAANAILGHDLSSKEIAVFDRTAILAGACPCP